MIDHIEPSKAIELLLKQQCTYKTEHISIYSAVGRILAEDIYAKFSVPPFNKSPFDGYAVKSADCPGTFAVISVVAAGEQTPLTVGHGEAVRIFTGAPVPFDTDLIIKQEDVRIENGYISIEEAFPPDTNVIHIGEDYTAGTLLAKAGTASKTSSVTRLLRGHLEIRDGSACFSEHPGRGNGNLSSFDGCDLIGIIPPCESGLEVGDVIEAIRIK